MKKFELISEISERTSIPMWRVRELLAVVVGVVQESLANGDDVRLFGLGKLSISERGEKKARNIRTGDVVVVPARKVPVFRPSDALVRAANGRADA